MTCGIVSVAINGLPITFREDGYINMTKAAKHFGKKPIKFLELPSTGEYLEAMAEASKVRKSDLVWAKRGGAPGQSGTWCHPKLAVFFARWLDVRFAVWCDLMIDNILHGNLEVSVVAPTEEVLALKV